MCIHSRLLSVTDDSGVIIEVCNRPGSDPVYIQSSFVILYNFHNNTFIKPTYYPNNTPRRIPWRTSMVVLLGEFAWEFARLLIARQVMSPNRVEHSLNHTIPMQECY